MRNELNWKTSFGIVETAKPAIYALTMVRAKRMSRFLERECEEDGVPSDERDDEDDDEDSMVTNAMYLTPFYSNFSAKQKVDL